MNSEDFTELYKSYLSGENTDIEAIELFFKLGYTGDSIVGGNANYELKSFNRFELYPVHFHKKELVELLFKYKLLDKGFKQIISGDNLITVAALGIFEKVYWTDYNAVEHRYPALENLHNPDTLIGTVENVYSRDYNPDYVLLKWLIEKGVDINEKDNNGFTTLIKAVNFNKNKLVSYLVSNGANLDEVYKTNVDAEKTALIVAIIKGNIEIVQTLINAGASIEQEVTMNKTVLNAYKVAQLSDNNKIISIFDKKLKQNLDNIYNEFPALQNIESTKLFTSIVGRNPQIAERYYAIKPIYIAIKNKDSDMTTSIANTFADEGKLDIAFYWYKKAMEYGSIDACYTLHTIYLDENGKYYDPSKVMGIMKKAISNGDNSGKPENNIGYYYAQGIGVEKSIEKARKYFIKSKNKGFSPASKNLEICNNILEKEKKEKNSEQEIPKTKSKPQGSNSYPQNEQKTTYKQFATVEFSIPLVGISDEKLTVNARNPQNVDVSSGNTCNISSGGMDDIRGTYDFTWTFDANNNFLLDPKYKTYSGTFQIDGLHDSYVVYLNYGCDGCIEVKGF